MTAPIPLWERLDTTTQLLTLEIYLALIVLKLKVLKLRLHAPVASYERRVWDDTWMQCPVSGKWWLNWLKKSGTMSSIKHYGRVRKLCGVINTALATGGNEAPKIKSKGRIIIYHSPDPRICLKCTPNIPTYKPRHNPGLNPETKSRCNLVLQSLIMAHVSSDMVSYLLPSNCVVLAAGSIHRQH